MADRAAQLSQLVDAHAAVFDGLLQATRGLDDGVWATPTGCPGWDVHDQLAHCVGLERRLLGDPDRAVDVPDLPHIRSEAGRFIERDVEVRRGTPGEDLWREAEETFARRLAALRELDPSDLDQEGDSILGAMRLSTVLRMRLFDLTSHERDIRAAVGRLDGLDGDHLDVALEQVLRMWGKTLPARLEGGGTLGIAVDSRPPVAVDLDAHGLLRGDEVPADPTTRVALSPAQVLALAGGRDDAPALDELTVQGDEGLAARWLEVAGITP